MNDKNVSIARSELLVSALRSLRDVRNGTCDPGELDEFVGLLSFSGSRKFYVAFSIAYQQMNPDNPDKTAKGNLFDATGRQVPFGSWHEYGSTVWAFHQVANSHPELVTSDAAAEQSPGPTISTVCILIERELLFAVNNSVLPIVTIAAEGDTGEQKSNHWLAADVANNTNQSLESIRVDFKISDSVQTWKRIAEREGNPIKKRGRGGSRKD